MKKIALIVLVCFCSLVSRAAHAETPPVEEEWDYLEITQGTPAPMNGLLFSYDGMSNALARVQQKIKLVEIQKNDEKEKLKIKLEADIKTSNAKLFALQEQHQAQIQVKDEAISSLNRQIELSKVKTAGGIVLGIAAGVLIMGLLNKK